MYLNEKISSHTMVILPINKLSCDGEKKCAGQNISLIVSQICLKDNFLRYKHGSSSFVVLYRSENMCVYPHHISKINLA